MKKTFELIEAYDKYIQLLSDECSDLSSMAMVHGWQSTRHKDGNRLREEISLLKMKILTQSAPITHEPASSGQSAEDVLKGMYGNNTQYGYSFNSTIEAMRLHASQVCADKDREIAELKIKINELALSAPITPKPASDKLIEAFCEKHAILPETLISVYNDNLERIKSILSTPEPGESGQSAEDYLVSNGLQVIGNYMFSMVDVAKMLTTYASQVCADKDARIKELEGLLSSDSVYGLFRFAYKSPESAQVYEISKKLRELKTK